MRLVVLLDEDPALIDLLHVAVIRRRPDAIVVGATTGEDVLALLPAGPDVLLLTAGHPDSPMTIAASGHVPVRVLLTAPGARLPSNRGSIDMRPGPTDADATGRLVDFLISSDVSR